MDPPPKFTRTLRRALLAEDPLHNNVFKHIDEAIRQLEQAAGELMRQD